MKAQLLDPNLLPVMTEQNDRIVDGLWLKIKEDDRCNHEECYICQRPVRVRDAEGNEVKQHRVRAYHGLSTIMSVESSDMIGETYKDIEAEIVNKRGIHIEDAGLIDEGGEGGNWIVGYCCAKKLGTKFVRIINPVRSNQTLGMSDECIINPEWDNPLA